VLIEAQVVALEKAKTEQESTAKRQPLKSLDADEETLCRLLHRWRNEADQAGRKNKRIVVCLRGGT
jgi:hypothetical protein